AGRRGLAAREVLEAPRAREGDEGRDRERAAELAAGAALRLALPRAVAPTLGGDRRHRRDGGARRRGGALVARRRPPVEGAADERPRGDGALALERALEGGDRGARGGVAARGLALQAREQPVIERGREGEGDAVFVQALARARQRQGEDLREERLGARRGLAHRRPVAAPRQHEIGEQPER